jgi:hypothetical protein
LTIPPRVPSASHSSAYTGAPTPSSSSLLKSEIDRYKSAIESDRIEREKINLEKDRINLEKDSLKNELANIRESIKSARDPLYIVYPDHRFTYQRLYDYGTELMPSYYSYAEKIRLNNLLSRLIKVALLHNKTEYEIENQIREMIRTPIQSITAYDKIMAEGLENNVNANVTQVSSSQPEPQQTSLKTKPRTRTQSKRQVKKKSKPKNKKKSKSRSRSKRGKKNKK